MTIVLVGLNNQTAPIALRERVYVAGNDLTRALITLHGDILQEIVIVSTCNRTEIYAHVSDSYAQQAAEILIAYFAKQAFSTADFIQPYLQHLTDREAVEHLMRVACGLESLVLGETEILGQISETFQQAQQARTIGAVLSRLFQNAIHTGKRARTETAISQHTLSISHAAVLMAKRHFQDLTKAETLVIGAGHIAELAARALKMHGARSIRIINRTLSKADALAQRVSGEALEWHDLQTALRHSDIVIAATSASEPILCVEDIMEARDKANHHSLVMVDLGVPRNIQAEARSLKNVWLYDIDDLHTVVDDHQAKRQAEATQVESIIAEALETFLDWQNSRSAVATIVELRQKAEIVAATELEWALHRLPELTEHERAVITQMAQRITNKLLHAPTTALRERAAQGDHFSYLHAARQLFNLDDNVTSDLTPQPPLRKRRGGVQQDEDVVQPQKSQIETETRD